jgi:hypothetical protein
MTDASVDFPDPLAPAVRAMGARDRAQQRRLAGAVRPDERDGLALRDVQRHLAHRLQQPVPRIDPLDGQQRQATALPR